MGTENSVRSENTEVPIIREIIVATTMISLFVALFTLLASTFRSATAILSLVVTSKNTCETWVSAKFSDDHGCLRPWSHAHHTIGTGEREARDFS